LADKLVVMACGKRLPRVTLEDGEEARRFLADVAAGRGVFILSSHCGTIEVLAALGACSFTFHAWMEFTRTSVFNRFYLRHQRQRKIVIHPVSGFSPATVFEAADALAAGDCLVMAGDRGFGRMRRLPFCGGERGFPEGAFRFARALEHPVYFVACVAVASCRYRVLVRRLPAADKDAMARAYAAALEEAVRAYPDQWFQWEGEEK
jgi:predicted LPLAT superfamily acyltransferase